MLQRDIKETISADDAVSARLYGRKDTTMSDFVTKFEAAKELTIEEILSMCKDGYSFTISNGKVEEVGFTMRGDV